MPLPLTVSCFSKIQIGLPFWYRLTWVVPEKGPLNGGVYAWDVKPQLNQSINPDQPTCGGTVVADAEATVRDDLVADKLEVETIAVRANETVYRASAVRADQRRRSETAISIYNFISPETGRQQE